MRSKIRSKSCIILQKGRDGLIAHNEIRDRTAVLMKEICRDVKTEPTLIEMNGGQLNEITANDKREADLDITPHSFWIPSQRVFLDTRVFNLVLSVSNPFIQGFFTYALYLLKYLAKFLKTFYHLSPTSRLHLIFFKIRTFLEFQDE